jgi:hypothetical protein
LTQYNWENYRGLAFNTNNKAYKRFGCRFLLFLRLNRLENGLKSWLEQTPYIKKVTESYKK